MNRKRIRPIQTQRSPGKAVSEMNRIFFFEVAFSQELLEYKSRDESIRIS
jgi:hypothetical protein